MFAIRLNLVAVTRAIVCTILAFFSTAGVNAFQRLHYRVKANVAKLSMSGMSVAVGGEPCVVAMTREDGKNKKLLKALEADASFRKEIEPIELPCIAHADGPDLPRLKECLLSKSWDYVAVTSPEGARVLASVWDGSSMSLLKVAAVGAATEKELKSNNIDVSFTPSKAYATNLVAELPGSAGSRVLYPASCKAPGTLTDGLAERGFEVERLDTYDTVTAEWTESQQIMSRRCQIVCFASPSSIKGWLRNSNNNKSVLAACIGETSATACKNLGWEETNIFCPENPGIDGWVDAIRKAVESLRTVAPARSTS